ncbi:PLP-dependent aminotransferase family protein, partial [Streptomyces sp. NPDC059744]
GAERWVNLAAAFPGLALDAMARFRHTDAEAGNDALVISYGAPTDSAWAGTLEALCRVLS